MPEPTKNRAARPENSNQKRLYVIVRPDIARLYMSSRSKWNEKASRQFCAQVEKVFTDATLRKNVLNFYVQHIDFFTHEKAKVRIVLRIGALTAALVNTLSFKMLHSGNVSELFRLLARYHAVREGLLAAPKKSSAANIKIARQSLKVLQEEALTPTLPSEQKKPDKSNSVKAIYSISRSTARDIQVLVSKIESKKMALIRDLIERAARREETKRIRLFYEENEEEFSTHEDGAIPLRLNLPPEIDALHNLVARKLFDSPRTKSKALRVIAAYYARQIDAGIQD